jgi:hypothetical protein
MTTYTDTNKAAKQNDPKSPIIREALAGHANELDILAVLAENPDYCSAISNGREINESTFSDGGLEVSEKTGFINGLIKGVPYQAPTRSPAQWQRYMKRCQRDARIRGIEFAFTKDGKARTQKKTRVKSRIDSTKAKAFRAKLNS